MLSDPDPLELLQSRIKSLGVRSKSSQLRLQKQVSPASFYGKVDEDDDDSTFEPEESSSSLTSELSAADELDLCIPEQEVVFLRQEAIDDGASDYQPSEDEDEQGGHRYVARAAAMIQSPNQMYGLPSHTVVWVCKLARFSHNENRWVDKGPVIVYFSETRPRRLQANYLYGTKSSAIDLVLYEQIDAYWRRFYGNRLQFGSFGYNLVRNAQTITEKCMMDQNSTVLKCTSRVYAMQEERSTVFTLKFLSDADLTNFGLFIQPILAEMKQTGFEMRTRTFTQPIKGFPVSTYSRSPEFVEHMARNGLEYSPVVLNNAVVENVQCSWCSVRLGPFHEVVNVENIHSTMQQQAGLFCSFCR